MDYTNNVDLTEEQKKYLGKILKKIKSIMPSDLYAHTIGTFDYAKKLAALYMNRKESTNHSYYRLYISCILHDYGKIFSYRELVEIAKRNKLDIGEFELNCPPLIHSFVGDYLVWRDFNIRDKKILRSIRFHSIGYCNMSIEDKILFISDKIEKNRKYDKVEEYRNLSFKNLDLCLKEIYKNTIIYVVKKDKLLHPNTGIIWNNICGGI